MLRRKHLILTLATAAVLLVACGGSSDEAGDASSAPSDSPSAAVTHTPESGEPELVQVPGFSYGDEVGQVAQFCDLFSADMISACSVHTVSDLGNGYLIVMEFAPDVTLGENPAADMVQGMTTAGSRVKIEKVDGEDVAVVDAGDGKTLIVGWAHDRTMYVTQGEDGDALETYVRGYITAQNA